MRTFFLVITFGGYYGSLDREKTGTLGNAHCRAQDSGVNSSLAQKLGG